MSEGHEPDEDASMAGPSITPAEFSILDIPGIECEVVEDGEQAEGSAEAVAGPSHVGSGGRRVSAIPSNSGWTFLLDSSMDDDHPLNVMSASSGAEESNRGEKSKKSRQSEDNDSADEAQERFERRKELTDKYIAGTSI